jgi:hypothetical protein
MKKPKLGKLRVHELHTHYAFYDMAEKKRISLIGDVIKEKNRDVLYFPVGLTHGNDNYGVKQGLIFLSPIWEHGSNGKWFRVGVSSPDDLDYDLDFYAEHIHMRPRVLKFLMKMDKHNRCYDCYIQTVKRAFPEGQISH